MSYKISLLLSSIFIVLFFAFGVDLLTIQFVYTDLDAKSTSISYLISKRGSLDENFIAYIEEDYHLDFVYSGNPNPAFGDVVNYTLSKSINTIVVSKEPMNISISRQAIIGYFGWKEGLMSELKGTLLGILLVLILFGTMSTVMVTTFNSMTSKVQSEVTEVIADLD